ncbi:MAG: type II secretion system protein GspM [Wenzhouxiangella sp.]
MQLLPELKNNRPLAVGLLLIALILVYLVGFHWFVQRHMALSDERQQLETQAARFKAAVARGPALEASLAELREERVGQGLFLPENGFSSAAAGMTRRLRETIDEEALLPELCTVQATQNMLEQNPGRFERVTVNVRMQCALEDLTRIVYALEDSEPLIFVDNVLLRQRVAAGQVGRRGSANYGLVEFQFNMYGFLTEQASRPPAS